MQAQFVMFIHAGYIGPSWSLLQFM